MSTRDTVRCDEVKGLLARRWCVECDYGGPCRCGLAAEGKVRHGKTITTVQDGRTVRACTWCGVERGLVK